MFEDQTKTLDAPPSNLPTTGVSEPVDIFAGVESGAETVGIAGAEEKPDALSMGKLRPKEEREEPAAAPLDQTVNQPINYKTSTPLMGKILIGVVIVAVTVGLILGGRYLYINFKKTAPVASAPTVPATVAPAAPVAPAAAPTAAPAVSAAVSATSSNTTTATNEMINDQILFGEVVDSDSDGLDDAREAASKTNPANPDTDADGLSDGDEVIVWGTDPLNPDTDGDGYPDGHEVKNGYSPLGPGRLFNLPATATTSPATSTAASSK